MKKLLILTILLSFAIFGNAQKQYTGEIETKALNYYRVQTVDETPLATVTYKGQENIWDYFFWMYLVEPGWPVWASEVEDRCDQFALDNRNGTPEVKVFRKYIIYKYYTDDRGLNADVVIEWHKEKKARTKRKVLKAAAMNAYYAFTSPQLQAEPITKFSQIRYIR